MLGSGDSLPQAIHSQWYASGVCPLESDKLIGSGSKVACDPLPGLANFAHTVSEQRSSSIVPGLRSLYQQDAE